jgi:formate dehydrogenase
VRVLGAPCVGRCEHAPVAVVGRNPVDHANVDDVARLARDGRVEPTPPAAVGYDAYRAAGGYRTFVA